MATALGSEDWLREHSRVVDLAQSLQILINERNRLASLGQAVSRENSILRKTHGEYCSGVNTLHHSLQKAASSPRAFGVTEREISRRKDLVTALLSRKDTLSAQISDTRGAAAVRSSEKDSLLGTGGGFSSKNGANNGGYSRHSGGVYSSTLETNETRALENNQLIAAQKQMIASQDDQLEDLSKSVNIVHNLANEIGGELDVHKSLLGDIENRTEKTSAKLKREQRKINKLSKKQKGCCAFVVMFLLIGILVTLILTKWGCTIVHSKEHCNN